METPDILNSKSLKGFIKGSLVLIGLFFILSFGVAALLIYFDKNIDANKNIEIDNNNETGNNSENDRNVKIEKKIEIGKNIDITKHIEIDNNDNKININKNIKTGKYFECKVFALILTLIILPLIIFLTVFLKFSFLVKSYYESSSIKDVDSLIKKYKTKVMGEACLIVARAIKPDSEKDFRELQNIVEIFEQFSGIILEDKKKCTEPEK